MKGIKKLLAKEWGLIEKLGMEPSITSTSILLSPRQIDSLMERIRDLEEEKFESEDNFFEKKDLLNLNEDLECEPITPFEREVACKEPDMFVLSSSNMLAVYVILMRLGSLREENKREGSQLGGNLHSLYFRLKSDKEELQNFLDDCTGPAHGNGTIIKLRTEVESLESILKKKIERPVKEKRNELHKLWDLCLYTSSERDLLQFLHSTDFTESLLEAHDFEVESVKKTLEENGSIYEKIRQWAEVFKSFIDLETKSRGPGNSKVPKGGSLLWDEKEKRRLMQMVVNIQDDLENVVDLWETNKGSPILVGGNTIKNFLEEKNTKHLEREAVKPVGDRIRRETIQETPKIKREKPLLHDTRSGFATTASFRFKAQSNSTKSTIAYPTPQRILPLTYPITSRGAKTSIKASKQSPGAGKSLVVNMRKGGFKREIRRETVSQNDQSKLEKAAVESLIADSRIIPEDKAIDNAIPYNLGFKKASLMKSTKVEIFGTKSKFRLFFL